ncbi:MAG: PAS domain S-box protein [Spirochaetota bacterium]
MPEAMVHTVSMEGAGVIIVEDESIIAMDIEAVLAQRGYRVLATVTDADEAVAKTGELSPDIVLMDIVLEDGQSGIDAAQRITDLYDIPVLYVTSHADENTVRRARSTGPYGYILKPVSDAELLISVEMVLYRHSMDRRLRASEEKYRRLFDNIRDVFFRTDSNGTIVLISPSAERVAGFTPGDLLGRDVATLYVDLDRRATALDILGEHGYFENFEAQLRKKDGGVFWASISAQVYRDASGGQEGIEGTIRDITAQKTAEDSLVDVRRQRRALLDNIPDMAWLKDLSGRYIVANHAFARMCGLPEEEVIGKSDFEIWPEEYARKFRKDDAEVIRSGLKMRVEERIARIGGTEVWIETIKMPIRDEHNEVYGTVGIARDIMERRQAEEALRESEERFRSLFEQSIVGIVITSHGEHGLMSANQAFRSMLGYSDDELRGLRSEDITHPEDIQAELALLGETLSGKMSGYSLEKRYLTKDGAIVWGRVTASHVYNRDGLPLFGVAIVEDVTDRKRAEEALRESEQTLRTLINANPEALFLVDAKGNILAANETLAKDLAKKLDDLNGACVYNFLPPEIAELFRKRIEEALRNSQPVRFDHRGPESYYDDYVYPIVDRDGSISRLAVFIKDITEHRKAGEEIKRLSREIMTSQEQERQKVARDLHDGVGQTIIAAKLNFSAFQKDRRKYRDRFEMGLQFIDKASQELREVYTGLYPSILSDLGLEAAVRWYAKNFLEANGIATSQNLDVGKLPHDLEVNLYRMMQEIFSNIIRHSGAGRVNIELSRPATGRAVVLAVEDDGSGFDPARLDELKKGFGLSNLRQRAEALGGEVGISSRPGRGTRIAIWIPLRGGHE